MYFSSGLNLDLSIYNTLLRVYMCNDHFFLPSESLERMKEQNISPNMVCIIYYNYGVKQTHKFNSREPSLSFWRNTVTMVTWQQL